MTLTAYVRCPCGKRLRVSYPQGHVGHLVSVGCACRRRVRAVLPPAPEVVGQEAPVSSPRPAFPDREGTLDELAELLGLFGRMDWRKM